MKRKLFKKALCLILTLSFLFAMSTQLAVGAFAYEPEDHTQSGTQIQNDYLKLYVDNGSHGIYYYTVEGNPASATDNNKQLLYNGTSRTYISVNGSIYRFNASSTKITPEGNSVYSTYTANGIKVDRIISFQYNTYTSRYDITEFKYVMTNTSNSTQSVGARIMFDTMLGNNDSAPFKVNGRDVTTQTQFTGDAIPQVWQVFDNLNNPTVVASGTFYNNVSERPDIVQFNAYGNSTYDVLVPTYTSGSSIGDSAVNAIFNPIDLAPGESRTVKTVYGISEFVPVDCAHRDANDDNYCDYCNIPFSDGPEFEPIYSFNYNAMAPQSLVVDAQTNTYAGNPFSFNGWVQNNGNMPLENVVARLELPVGLSVVGDAAINLGTVSVGASPSIFWNIEAAPQYTDSVLTYRLVISADNAETKIAEFTISLPALDVPCQHNGRTNWIVDSVTSCTDRTVGHYECAECGEYMYSGYGAAIGHDYKIVATTEATCTVDGCLYFECDREGCDATKEQVLPAFGHTFDANYVCITCGFVLDRHVHEYTVTTVDPGCVTMGYTEFACECGYSYRADYIEMLGHSWNEGEIVVEKTCTEDGVIRYTCQRCNGTYDTAIEAGHEWSEVVTTPATCTEDGLITRTCLDCQAEETEVIPAAHTWNEGTVVLEPTCTTDGYKVCECQVCGHVADITIDRLGHHYYNGICTRCGDKFIYNVTQGDHPQYGMYFEIEDIVSNYGPDIINEYGLLLDYNEGAIFDKVAIYLTQEGNMWRRCIACTGENIQYATYVPYLSYGDDIKYTGLNSDWINIFRLSENADGIWCYSNYATIGVNLQDNKGNLLLSLYDIGQAGTETRIFDDLAEMIAWLSGDADNDCDHSAGRWIVVNEPTYETEGLRVKRCVDCNAILESEVLPRLNDTTAKVVAATSSIAINNEIVFTLTIENCTLVEALAVVPQFDSSIFELVDASWSISAPLYDVDFDTNKAILAFDEASDVNGVVFTFKLRANATTVSTNVGCILKAQIDKEVVDMFVISADVEITPCDHSVTQCVSINGEYHSARCVSCGYTVEAEHVFDSACDSTCDDCGYTRVAPHAYSHFYSKDAFGHWHVCELCGQIGYNEQHIYDSYSDSDCNVCGHERFVRGDVDNDGDIDSDDSVYLVYVIFFGGVEYPVYQSLDFNGDGIESTDDAVYLLYYVFFGSQVYPLY